jgi:hypothetical protein
MHIDTTAPITLTAHLVDPVTAAGKAIHDALPDDLIPMEGCDEIASNLAAVGVFLVRLHSESPEA